MGFLFMGAFYITPKGYERLKEEIQRLKSHDRHEVIKAIATAREYGDLSENAEYHAAREKQSFIEGRIIDLEDKLSKVEVIDTSKLTNDTVKFGASVQLLDNNLDHEVVYIIVGEYESDIAKGLISIVSPLGRELIGKKIGDQVEVTTPKGVKSYEVLNIEFKALN
jgi:transcription elongation factor GreA